jgi:hypothetical protein
VDVKQISDSMTSVQETFETFGLHHCKHRTRILSFATLNAGLTTMLLTRLQQANELLLRQDHMQEKAAHIRAAMEVIVNNAIETLTISLKGTILELAQLKATDTTDAHFYEDALRQVDRTLERLGALTK